MANSAKNHKKRIIDILIVGIILGLSPKIGHLLGLEPLELGGLGVFAYGWGILIVQKFREGLNNN